MTEKTNEQEEEQKKAVKKTRKKASTGPWWKSTTVVEISEPLPPPPVNAEPPALKTREAPLPADQDGAPTVVQKESETAEPADKQPRKRSPERPSRRGSGRPRKSQTKKQNHEQEQDAEAAVSEEPVSEAVQDSDRKLEGKSPRKRGRPRKKQSERSTSVQAAEETAVDVPETAVASEAAEAQNAEKTEQPVKKGGRKRQPRKKRTEGSAAETSLAEEKDRQSAIDETALDEDEGIDSDREENRQKEPGKKPVIKLLINAEEPEECRLALLEDGRLESIHVATSTRTQTKNNIYKAKIVAIEPNLQAAFVDYGTEKNGFLPFSEIHPEYYKENVSGSVQNLIDQHQWKKLSITDVMERGREVLVQVVKEEVGKKGANMTTYLSLPGRCVVLMPGSDSTGISRKISGEEQRNQLRDYMLSMNIPEGIGWIVRTASVDITKTALTRDVNYLLNLWEEVKKKGQELDGVGLIYQDHDHVLRFLREHFDPDIQEILVDDENALDQVKAFIELLPAKQRKVRCKLHKGARPIFNQYSIEDQIESIYQPKVNLPSGGSIVIDPTEALVAIDVNSGSTQKGKNFEDTIFQANMEAATELARQLRLRDLGGLIVVDFIDMRSKKNIREVEKQVKTAMKRDKAKVDVSRISKFGLMQISRQKLGAPIEAGNYRVCTSCKGRGVVRSVETMALYHLRRIHTAASRKQVKQVECRFPLDVASYLLNNKRCELRELEVKYDTEVIITAEPSYFPGEHDIVYHKGEKEEIGKIRS